MRTLGVAAAAALLTATLAACGGGENSTPDEDATAPAENTTEQPADSDDGDDGTYTFGQTSDDVVATTVEWREREFTASQTAMPPGERGWAVDMTFENTGDEPISPAMFQVLATVDGDRAQEIMDHDSGYDGLVSVGPIAPGQSVTVPVAYTGQGSEHSITVSSMDGSNSTVFESKE